MAFRLYDLPEIEPSSRVGFAGNRIDRLSEKRQDDSAFTALELPETRVLLLCGNRLLLDYAEEKAPRVLFSAAEAQAFAPDLAEPVLLGLLDGNPIVALTAALVGAYGPGDIAADATFLMSGGRVIRGVVEGGADPQTFIPELLAHYRAGRFPFDRLVRFFAFADIADAIAQGEAGHVVKPILRIP